MTRAKQKTRDAQAGAPAAGQGGAPATVLTAGQRNGILPRKAIKALVEGGEIFAERTIEPEQLQPASLDLRLGNVAYRVRASFLPGPQASIPDKLDAFKLHEIDLKPGAVLETGCVYVVPLMEQLRLRAGISATANPKSSTGRMDVFTRLIVDRSAAFDQVPNGYAGKLYAEISPRTFSVLVRPGVRLNQLRFQRGDKRNLGISDKALRAVHDGQHALVDCEPKIRDGLALSVNLAGEKGRHIGYRARRHAGVVDLDRVAAYEWYDFWEPIYANAARNLILDPNEFYILASKEKLHIPSNLAAEMVPIDTSIGEFRVHYAGFFDPGFGYTPSGKPGSRAVLEVRSHEVPFVLEDGQPIGRLSYERLSEEPDEIYGAGIGSNYQGQALKLSKHFKMPE